MAERIALIVNPKATRVRPALRRRLVELLTPHGLSAQFETTATARAGDLAREAASAGATIVVALGGDGTVNEVAGALAGCETAVLPVAGGSTNVFTRAVGWPHPATEAFDPIARALTHPDIRTIRIGLIRTEDGERPFCINAGAGFDANTVQRLENHPVLKQTLRQLGVGLISVSEAVRSARREPCLTVTADGGSALTLASLIVAAGSPYAFLGPRPLDLAPGAAFDGRLRWMGITETSLKELSTVIRGGLGHGRHIGREGILDGWASAQITVSADHPVAIQADGEPLGRHSEVVFAPGPTLRVVSAPGAAATPASGQS